MISYGHHRYPGRLFVVEGTDGSGKSTQLTLLYQWLKAEGYPVFFSEWNSSPLVKDTTRRAKKRRLFTPATFSLLHATDFADRTERRGASYSEILRSRPGHGLVRRRGRKLQNFSRQDPRRIRSHG